MLFIPGTLIKYKLPMLYLHAAIFLIQVAHLKTFSTFSAL